MALNGRRVTVSTAATRIDAAESDDKFGRSIAVKNAGTVAVALGSSSVTTATGFELAAGETVSVDLDPGETLYGIVAAATQIVHVLENGI